MKSNTMLFWIISIVVVLLIPLIIRTNDYFLTVFITIIIDIIITASLRTIASVGQICVAIMAFTGVGAYTSALLMMKYGLPIIVTMPLAGLISMAVAALIAYPTVKVTGMYFAMITLFFGEIMVLVFTGWRSLTGGSTGLTGIPSIGTLSLFGAHINFAHLVPYAYFSIIVMFICLFFLYRIDHSHLGTTLASIEQDEAAANSVGINVIGYKVISFCIGAFFAGIGGSLYVHFFRVVVPDSFGLFPSIYILIYLVGGGRKKFIGPVVGTVVLALVPQVFGSLKAYWPFVYVGVLYLVLYLMPGGMVDLPVLLKPRLMKLLKAEAAND